MEDESSVEDFLRLVEAALGATAVDEATRLDMLSNVMAVTRRCSGSALRRHDLASSDRLGRQRMRAGMPRRQCMSKHR